MSIILLGALLGYGEGVLWEPVTDIKLAEVVSAIEALRSGDATDFTALDGLANQLLASEVDSIKRGVLLFALAHVEAQSGMKRPEKFREYATGALRDLESPARRAVLWCYLGDLARIDRSIGVPSERRKLAAEQYLRGLSEVLRYELPESPPPTEAGRFFDLAAPAEEERRYREQGERIARNNFLRMMCLHRDVLTKQIREMYLQKPASQNELVELARNAGIASDDRAKLVDGLPEDPAILARSVQTERSKWILIGNSAVLAVLVLYLVVKWLIRMQRSGEESI